MKSEKSVGYISVLHVMISIYVFPFIGTFAIYFIHKYLAVDIKYFLLIDGFIKIIFFFIGVKVSLLYINNKFTIDKPQLGLTISIILFSFLGIANIVTEFVRGFSNTKLLFDSLYFITQFVIFYILTRNYFMRQSITEKA